MGYWLGLRYLQGLHELQWDQQGRWDQFHPESQAQTLRVRGPTQSTPGQVTQVEPPSLWGPSSCLG